MALQSDELNEVYREKYEELLQNAKKKYGFLPDDLEESLYYALLAHQKNIGGGV